MIKAKYVGESINAICSTNIYENRRHQDLVDCRALCCYILHKDLKMTLYAVRDHFNKNGKKMTHCTVLHCVNLFEDITYRKPHLKEVREMILGKLDPKYLLLKKIELIEDQYKINQISNCIKQYE